MAENLYLDLSITVACERYNLDEDEWLLNSFTDGSKAITVGLENAQTGAKIKASFPREEIRFEEMKRWSEAKKLAYVQGMIEAGQSLPPQLVDAFHDIMLKLELPTTMTKAEEENSIIVEDKPTSETSAEPEEETEVTEEQSDKKTSGKKTAPKKKYKRKAV